MVAIVKFPRPEGRGNAVNACNQWQADVRDMELSDMLDYLRFSERYIFWSDCK